MKKETLYERGKYNQYEIQNPVIGGDVWKVVSLTKGVRTAQMAPIGRETAKKVSRIMIYEIIGDL